jgi:hypothetical protein
MEQALVWLHRRQTAHEVFERVVAGVSSASSRERDARRYRLLFVSPVDERKTAPAQPSVAPPRSTAPRRELER